MTEQLDVSKGEGPRSVRGWSPDRPILWCALALAVVLVRGGVLVLPGALSDDPDGYRLLAENLVEHHCLGTGENATAYRPPLYPVLLAACLTLDPGGHLTIGVLHLASGLLTVWLVWRLGISWGLGRCAPVAALLVAVDPLLLAHSASVMTETVATLLTCVSLVCLTRAAERPSTGRVALAGGCLALAILCRPTFLIWAAAVACTLPWLAVYNGRRKTGATAGLPSSEGKFSRKSTAGQASSGTLFQPASLSERIKVFAVFVLSAGIVLAPWIVRNQIHFGRPVIGTTHGGYTLLLGNNPSFYEYLGRGSWGTVWDATEFDREWVDRMNDADRSDEVSRDRLAYSDGVRTIRDQPRMFLYSCLVRVGRLWSPLPHRITPDETTARRLARYAVGLWYLVELSLAAIGVAIVLRGFPSRKFLLTGWLWGLLLAVSFTAVHAVYWSNIRMRSPLMPVAALALAAAIMRLRAAANNRKIFSSNKL
jgi:dolichyl-phosphate-mannose-protein mannosyltransferase